VSVNALSGAGVLELQSLIQRVRNPNDDRPLHFGFVPNGGDPIVYWSKQNKVTVARFAAKLKKAGETDFDPTPFYSGTIQSGGSGPRFKVDHTLSRGDVRERPMKLGLKQISRDVGDRLAPFKVLKHAEVDLSVDVISSDELKEQLGKAKGWGTTGYAKILKDLKKAEKADSVEKKLARYMDVLGDIDDWIRVADSDKHQREVAQGKHGRDNSKRAAFTQLRTKLTGVIEQLRRELQAGSQDELVQQQVSEAWDRAEGEDDEEQQRQDWSNLASQVRKADQLGARVDVDRLGLAARLVDVWGDHQPTDKVLRDVLTLTGDSMNATGRLDDGQLDTLAGNITFLQEEVGRLDPEQPRARWLLQRLQDLKSDLSSLRTQDSVQQVTDQGHFRDSSDDSEPGDEPGTSGSYFVRQGANRRAAVFKPAQQEAILTGSRTSGENTRGEVLGYRLARTVYALTGLEIPVPKTTLATLESDAFETWGCNDEGLFEMPSTYGPGVNDRVQVGALQRGVTDVRGNGRDWTVNVRSDDPSFRVEVTGDTEEDMRLEDELGRASHPFWDELPKRHQDAILGTLRKRFVPPDSIPKESIGEDLGKVAILDVITLQMDRNADNLLLSGDPPDAHLIPIDQGNCLPCLDDAIGTMHQWKKNPLEGWLDMDGAELPFTAEALQAIEDLDPDDILEATRSEGARLEESSEGRIPAPTDEQLLVQHLSVRCLKAAQQRAGDALSPRTLGRLIASSDSAGRGTALFVQTLEELRRTKRGLDEPTLTRDHFDQAFHDVFLAGLDEALRLAALEDWGFRLDESRQAIDAMDDGEAKASLRLRLQGAQALSQEGKFPAVRRYAERLAADVELATRGERSTLGKAYAQLDRVMASVGKVLRVRPEEGEQILAQALSLEDLLDDDRMLAFLRGAEYLDDKVKALLRGPLVEFDEETDFSMRPPLAKIRREEPLVAEEGYFDPDLHWDEVVSPAIQDALQTAITRDDVQREITLYVEWDEFDDFLEPVRQTHAEAFEGEDLTPKAILGGSRLLSRSVRAAQELTRTELRTAQATKADTQLFLVEPAYPTAEDHWDSVMRGALRRRP